MFNNSFLANFLETVSVKEVFKSVNIWRRRELEYDVSLFLIHRVESWWAETSAAIRFLFSCIGGLVEALINSY